MSKLSQAQKVIEFLRQNEGERFSARQIAEAIVSRYPEDYEEKRKNPRFTDEKSFISQVIAEIGAQKNQLGSNDNYIHWQDKPRPRVYWYSKSQPTGHEMPDFSETGDDDGQETPSLSQPLFTEHDLYPVLVEYLKSELRLLCQRIDERRSKNSRGTGGNQWLHPDIVAIQPVDKEWNELIRNCVKHGGGQSVRLWSFEVKKHLTGSNVRKSFFQAVSNSGWANEGYLVSTSISDSNVEQELRMLSALHGIGVILLNPENPSESEILLPAQARDDVNWQSVNRILAENDDFKDFIELVSTYYQTGRVRSRDWNKV